MNLLNQKIDWEKDAMEVERVSLGLIGVSFIAISETVGRKLLIRNINHIMQYCDVSIKRMVPIMLTILGVH